MEANIRTNEYVHEHGKHRQSDGWWMVYYEPCEYTNVSDLTGAIYVGDRLTQTFYVKEGREIVLANAGNRKCKAVSGCFSPRHAVIALYWDSDPGEHFLCVSYEFQDREVLARPCWLKEGF